MGSVSWSLNRQWWLSASEDQSLRIWTHGSPEPAIIMVNVLSFMKKHWVFIWICMGFNLVPITLILSTIPKPNQTFPQPIQISEITTSQSELILQKCPHSEGLKLKLV